MDSRHGSGRLHCLRGHGMSARSSALTGGGLVRSRINRTSPSVSWPESERLFSNCCKMGMAAIIAPPRDGGASEDALASPDPHCRHGQRSECRGYGHAASHDWLATLTHLQRVVPATDLVYTKSASVAQDDSPILNHKTRRPSRVRLFCRSRSKAYQRRLKPAPTNCLNAVDQTL